MNFILLAVIIGLIILAAFGWRFYAKRPLHSKAPMFLLACYTIILILAVPAAYIFIDESSERNAQAEDYISSMLMEDPDTSGSSFTFLFEEENPSEEWKIGAPYTADVNIIVEETEQESVRFYTAPSIVEFNDFSAFIEPKLPAVQNTDSYTYIQLYELEEQELRAVSSIISRENVLRAEMMPENITLSSQVFYLKVPEGTKVAAEDAETPVNFHYVEE
ncbi:hypothetical protein [Alkalicoccus daliensis]|uniref:Uncharacterized protein n=1 Tax=Alkalicoccus daliensis TaxID=745820 RepID=A0A1H0H1B5_9BACI|nr:hypothetical protein [Alkalicoccus daliensis]SDO12862.1 hypothetical protein SAMN04488053_107133 [Alkalicoccus daliensis]